MNVQGKGRKCAAINDKQPHDGSDKNQANLVDFLKAVLDTIEYTNLAARHCISVEAEREAEREALVRLSLSAKAPHERDFNSLARDEATLLVDGGCFATSGIGQLLLMGGVR